jgi:hypothetical protein
MARMPVLSASMLIMIHRIVIVILAVSLLCLLPVKLTPSLWGEYVDPIQFGRATEKLGEQQQ